MTPGKILLKRYPFLYRRATFHLKSPEVDQWGAR